MKQSVFITGTDKGLGRALADRFQRADWHVFGGRYAGGCESTELLTEIPLDVTDIQSVTQAAAAVAEHGDGLDVLINCAGILLTEDDATIEALDFDAVMATFDVNSCGPLRVVQQFLPLLQQGRSKLIINISSEAGSIEDSTRIVWYGYCMSKAAVNMQSKILENYLKPQGFKILAVHPGGMRTDMLPVCSREASEAADDIFGLVNNPDKAGDALFIQFDGSVLPF